MATTLTHDLVEIVYLILCILAFFGISLSVGG